MYQAHAHLTPYHHNNNTAISPQPRLGDDTLDVAALQGVPGIVGTLAVGIVAQGNYASSPGLVAGGGFALLGKQAVATIVTIVWSFIWTYALMKFMKYTVKVCADAHGHLPTLASCPRSLRELKLTR